MTSAIEVFPCYSKASENGRKFTFQIVYDFTIAEKTTGLVTIVGLEIHLIWMWLNTLK